MAHKQDVNRREFLQRIGAGALAGAAGLHTRQARAQSGPGWTPPAALKNPNILVIMVDQMRAPTWLPPAPFSLQSELPNIMGRIQNNSYNFGEFFVAATVCTASRSALLTGLYAPQTAVYANLESTSVPNLLPAFPTWGEALAVLNPAYQGNVWWFGKWHLSDQLNATPLLPYGFNTRTYPGGPKPYNPSPDGQPNEGCDGGQFGGGATWASDAMIAGDFIGWLEGQAPTNGLPDSPWCATVSLVNPHDITFAPAWLQTTPFPPTGVPMQPVYFPPPPGPAPALYTNQPSPWNFENLADVPNKPSLQVQFLNWSNQQNGTVTSWTTFLNQYFWLQNYADQQVGLVLNALASSAFANNTVIIFLSDHGEYGGSHGLHTKGFAVYDESINVPFYVQFPGQTGSVAMNQMCSAVDVFGLICDLATGGSGQWRLAYPDLANRQSIWSFLYHNSSETRVAPAPVGLPYIFHTFDQAITPQTPGKCHIVCMRTKQNVNTGQIGAKLAFYYEWAPCTTYPDATPPDAEFYDYSDNTSETGNDYFDASQTVQNTITNYTQAMGTLGPVSTGLVGSELNAPLVGTGTDGNPLTQALASAQQAYFTYASGAGACTEA
jgi:arylsulfatase A-like enzyme